MALLWVVLRLSWRWFFKACPGILLLVRALFSLGLVTSLGSRRCPDAGLGMGVRLVVLGLSLWWFSRGSFVDPVLLVPLFGHVRD